MDIEKGEDMTQETNNDDVLLKYLQNGNIVTTRTAPEELGIADVRANIRSLRAKGYEIQDEWKEDINRRGNKVRYKEYFIKKMNNFERLKQLSIEDFAYAVCIDNEGENRGCCPLCKRHFQNNCDDRCIKGVIDYLQEEDK